MRLVIVSDTHNRKKFTVPDGDVLVHCGDFTMLGTSREIKAFDEWLNAMPHPRKIVIAGNHDCGFEEKPAIARRLLKNATYLQDTSVTIDGLKFYGSPWQPWFFDWSFNLPRGAALAAKWSMIPGDVDVLLTHGPPRGILDQTGTGEHAGCDDLLGAVQRIKPFVHAFGHIHGAAGAVRNGATLFVNASICDESYVPCHPPIVVDVVDRVAILVPTGRQ